jgi:hypothetical protein
MKFSTAFILLFVIFIQAYSSHNKEVRNTKVINKITSERDDLAYENKRLNDMIKYKLKPGQLSPEASFITSIYEKRDKQKIIAFIDSKKKINILGNVVIQPGDEVELIEQPVIGKKK